MESMKILTWYVLNYRCFVQSYYHQCSIPLLVEVIVVLSNFLGKVKVARMLQHTIKIFNKTRSSNKYIIIT